MKCLADTFSVRPMMLRGWEEGLAPLDLASVLFKTRRGRGPLRNLSLI
jgi:hypothetical protein